MAPPLIPPGVHKASALIQLCVLAFEIIGATQLTPYIDMMVSQIMGVEKGDQAVAMWVCVIVGTYNISEALCARFWGATADRIGYRSAFIISISGDMFTTLLFGFSRSLPFAFAARFVDGCFCGNTPLAMGWMGSCVSDDNDTLLLAWPATAAALGFIVGPLFGSLLAEPAVWAPATFGGTIFESYPYLLPNLTFALMKLALLALVVLVLREPPTGGAACTASKLGLRIGFPMSPTLTRCIVMTSLFTGMIQARMNCFVVLGSLPRSAGGLAMSEGNYGLLLIISAVAVVAYNLTVYPAIIKRFGPHRTIILASVLCFFVMVVTPLTGLTADPAKFGSWRLVPIGVWQVCFPPLATMVIVSGMTLINREAPASHRAETMGLFQSANALARGVVIYISGVIMDFGLRAETAHGFVGGRYLAFYLLSGFCFFNIHTILKIGIPPDDEPAKEGYQSLTSE